MQMLYQHGFKTILMTSNIVSESSHVSVQQLRARGRKLRYEKIMSHTIVCKQCQNSELI